MTDADTDAEDTAVVVGPTPEAERPPNRTVPAAAFVAAVLVAGALGILAVVALSTGGGGDSEADDARFAAGRFAERFLTFDHDALDEWKADVLSLSTGGFAGEVEDVEEGLRRLIGESELDATTQVTEIFVGDIDNGSTSVVLIYDRDVTGASGTRSETDRYMQLEMNLVDGEWLVDDVIDISTAGGLDDPALAEGPEPGESITTSVPPG